jgi:acyl-CoA thioester hydrolase
MHQRALKDGQLLAEARLRVGFVGPDGRPRRQPAAWRSAFAPIIASPEGSE